jgi:Family of unknown function (DUF5993)
MIMMLPFLTALVSVCLAWRGHRCASVGAWLITLAIFIAWCFCHMTDAMNLSL